MVPVAGTPNVFGLITLTPATEVTVELVALSETIGGTKPALFTDEVSVELTSKAPFGVVFPIPTWAKENDVISNNRVKCFMVRV